MDIHERATIIGREIIYSPRFEKELSAIESDHERADEFVRGVCHRIARFPDRGQRRNESSNVWGLTHTDIHGYPPCVLYYSFNERYIILNSIKISEHEPDIEILDL